jgi:hypothetical protein
VSEQQISDQVVPASMLGKNHGDMVGANEVRFAWLNRDLDDGTPHGTHRGKSSPNRGSIVSRLEKGCDLYEVEHVKA